MFMAFLLIRRANALLTEIDRQVPRIVLQSKDTTLLFYCSIMWDCFGLNVHGVSFHDPCYDLLTQM